MTSLNKISTTEIAINAGLTLQVWTAGDHEEIHLFRPNGALGGNEQGVVYETRRMHGVSHERAVAEGLLMAANYMISKAA